jgi:hypothetical protein
MKKGKVDTTAAAREADPRYYGEGLAFMPTTLPGWLLLLGTILIVASVVKGRIAVKEVEVQEIDSRGRNVLMVLGALFIITSGLIYYKYMQTTDFSSLPIASDYKEGPTRLTQ